MDLHFKKIGHALNTQQSREGNAIQTLNHCNQLHGFSHFQGVSLPLFGKKIKSLSPYNIFSLAVKFFAYGGYISNCFCPCVFLMHANESLENPCLGKTVWGDFPLGYGVAMLASAIVMIIEEAIRNWFNHRHYSNEELDNGGDLEQQHDGHVHVHTHASHGHAHGLTDDDSGSKEGLIRRQITSQWRVRKKGSASNPYHDYRKFPTVFCLKINHGGAFTSPPKVRYKGGKVNWIDTIDSERFSVVEVATMMQELGYENGSSGMDFFYKLPNSDLDNGLRKLETDKDASELMTHVSKYKVIDLYVDHCVSKNIDEEQMMNNVNVDMAEFKKNIDKNSEWIGCAETVEEVTEVVEEDGVDNDELCSGTDSDNEGERRKALRNLTRMNKLNEGKIWKENFFIGQQFANSKLIKEMVTRVAVEQRRELWLKKNDKLRVRVVCKGKTPTFTSNKSPLVDGGLADGPGKKGKPIKSKIASGSKIRSKGNVPIKDSETQCPWSLQCSKLPNEDTWQSAGGGSNKAGVGSKKGSGGSKKGSGGSKKATGGSKKASGGSKKANVGSQSQQVMVMSQGPPASQTSVVGTQASQTRVRPLPLLLQDSPSKRTKTTKGKVESSSVNKKAKGKVESSSDSSFFDDSWVSSYHSTSEEDHAVSKKATTDQGESKLVITGYQGGKQQETSAYASYHVNNTPIADVPYDGRVQVIGLPNNHTWEVLEIGILIHSIILGISIGVSSNPKTIKPLIVALSFHHMLEGMGLGSCLSEAKFGIGNMAKMCVSFSVTTPIGIAIWYEISKTYDENSHLALILEGVFNAASAGILIYMVLVDLLAVDFMKAKVHTSLKLQVLAYISLLLGIGCMYLLAIWA
ncbi:Zinc/iron permease [Artemisia annua]|uniref:Zinc/iron permease n=1 Tax=Artemisia annua TaxID=35608 RepID=A0A2U1PXB1_ARTAN|nr:Zinc/iron permease [Artemisia annua]